MPAAHCAICLNDFAVDSGKPEFVIFLCGHGFCCGCADRLFTGGRTKCPNCRKPIHKRDGHPVYLELVDSEKLITQTVIEGLDKMDVDTHLVSIRKAGQKVEQAIENASEDSLRKILTALEDFKKRVLPACTKAELQKQDIERLRRDVQRVNREKDELQTKLKELDILNNEVARLGMSLADAEASTEQAIGLAEMAKDQIEQERKITDQYRARVQALEAENKRLRDANERHKANANHDKEKYRKLHTKYTTLKERQKSDTQGSSQAVKSPNNPSRNENSQMQITMLSSPSQSSRHIYSDEHEVELDFQGMPPPTFNSDWQFDGSVTGILKKRVPNGLNITSHRRVGNSFPIDLDSKGHPKKAVHLGPRSIVRLSR